MSYCHSCGYGEGRHADICPARSTAVPVPVPPGPLPTPSPDVISVMASSIPPSTPQKTLAEIGRLLGHYELQTGIMLTRLRPDWLESAGAAPRVISIEVEGRAAR